MAPNQRAADKQVISLALPLPLIKKIKAEMDKQGIDRSKFISNAVEEYIKQLKKQENDK